MSISQFVEEPRQRGRNACVGLLVFISISMGLAARCQAETLSASERAGRVRIVRDRFGIPHIRGKTDADVAFGLAYAHAEDDFETIQESLAQARGRMGETNGLQGLPGDYLVSLLKVREFVDAKYETDLTIELREYCEAYAAGLTYFAQKHPQEVDRRFLPYTGKDVICGFVFRQPFFFGLQGVLSRVTKGSFDKPTEADELQVSVSFDGRLPIGSNAFAVGPSRSADGRTRLNINSHQPWEGLVSWYEAHLKSDQGLDVIGGLFPGCPFILHGHNRHLGWAFTVNKPDLIDVYRIKVNPENPHEYELDGQWREFEVATASLRMKLFGETSLPVKLEMLYSSHGPVMQFKHGHYAIRFAGWGEIRAAEQYFRMNKARNFDEWIAAVRMRWIPSLNFCYADKAGNIYYLYNGLIPRRKQGPDWRGVLPGNRSDLIWSEYIPFDSLPQVTNPKSGIVQNSNSSPFQATFGSDNVDAEQFSADYGIETRQTDRSHRIRELLAADQSITHEEFLDYKWDQTVSTRGRMWRLFQPILNGTPPDDLKQPCEILKNWNRILAADSTAASLASMYYYQFVKANYFGTEEPEPYDALRIAVAHLQKHFGGIDVPLGELQRLRRGDVDLPIGGGPRTYNCVHAKEDEKDGRLVGLAGDCYVLIVAFDENGVASSQAIHQYGNVNRPTSPHYADQAEMFVQRKMRDSLFSDATLKENTLRDYHPGDETTP